jgi:GNAT superfamily N-acetyltransferase
MGASRTSESGSSSVPFERRVALRSTGPAGSIADVSTDPADVIPYRASAHDAGEVARLLHDFNTEFETSSPGVSVLAGRLKSLLAGPSTIAYLIGRPAEGVALVTLRSNVWYGGPVALLDELYVRPHRRGHGLGTAMIDRLLADATATGISAIEINVDESDVDAQRFYERQGFSGRDPGTGERAFYYALEL